MANDGPELRVDEHVPRVQVLSLLPCWGDVAEGDLSRDDEAGEPEAE